MVKCHLTFISTYFTTHICFIYMWFIFNTCIYLNYNIITTISVGGFSFVFPLNKFEKEQKIKKINSLTLPSKSSKKLPTRKKKRSLISVYNSVYKIAF